MPNRTWSEPIKDSYEYVNEFGKVVFTPVTEFMNVGQITSEMVPAGCMVDMDTAEKATLITENRRAMMSPTFPITPNCFAVQYINPNTAAICSIEVVEFHTPGNISAQEQIESMIPKFSGPMGIY